MTVEVCNFCEEVIETKDYMQIEVDVALEVDSHPEEGGEPYRWETPFVHKQCGADFKRGLKHYHDHAPKSNYVLIQCRLRNVISKAKNGEGRWYRLSQKDWAKVQEMLAKPDYERFQKIIAFHERKKEAKQE